MARIEDLLESYDTFCGALKGAKDLAVDLRAVPPSTGADIAKVERALGVTVPPDLRALWLRGFRNVSVHLGGKGVTSVELVGAKGALAQIKVALDVAKSSKDNVLAPWLRHGIPFQAGESYCFLDAGPRGAGVVRQMVFDGDAPEEPVASTFTGFFAGWLASGCYDDGAADPRLFEAYRKVVAAFVPLAIPPDANAWLAHLGRLHGKPKAFAPKAAAKTPARSAKETPVTKAPVKKAKPASDRARSKACESAFEHASALAEKAAAASGARSSALHDEAVAAFEGVIAIAFPPYMRTHAKITLARLLRRAGRHEPLLALTTELTRADDFFTDVDRANAWSLHAAALRRAGKLDEARAAVDTAIAAEATHAPSLHERACIFTATRQLDKAIADVGRALELDPELSSALATDDDLAALRGKASWKRLFRAS